VKVRRLTYTEADQLLDGVPGDAAAAILRSLNTLAEQNMKRRIAAGAVNIDLPEIHISFFQGRPVIESVLSYRSSDLVRECMLLAGEGAGIWAAGRMLNTGQGLAFPFVSQEAGDIPGEILEGFAGSYQLRRCMRPRTLSARPAPHWGLGLDVYTQVTSPLRRYTDLLAHLQIRAMLRGGEPLSAEEVSVRLGAAEAAAQATTQAERASKLHWTLVYLSDKKDSIWDAVALEKKGNRWAMVIPALALETQVPLRNDIAPNDTVKLALKSVNIPRGEAIFSEK
jgi:exoribonuclease-2